MELDADHQAARDFNVWDPALADDPFTRLREIQSQCPVAWSEELGGHWVVTSYDGAQRVLSQAQLYSSRCVFIPPIEDPPKLLPLTLDPPEHTAYRQILTAAFSPKRMRELEPKARKFLRELLSKYVAQGGGDFVSSVAVPYPSVMFLELAGLPIEDLEVLLEWKESFIRGLTAPDLDVREEVQRDVMPEIVGYFQKLAAQRANDLDPPDDLLTTLVQGRLRGERPLSPEEITNILIMLMIAGLDTVTNVLTMAVEKLATRPVDRALLSDEPEVLPTAVEEILRMCSVVSMVRQAKAEDRLDGAEIRPGDWITTVTPISNRDPRVFDQPDQLDLKRAENRHIAFGAGPHRCLGAHLARVELLVALEVIHQEMPDYHIAPRTRPKHHFGGLMGCSELILHIGTQGEP